jgi:hypothetical protein
MLNYAYIQEGYGESIIAEDLEVSIYLEGFSILSAAA